MTDSTDKNSEETVKEVVEETTATVEESLSPDAPAFTQATVGNRVLAALIDSILASMMVWFLGRNLGMLIYLGYMLTRDALPFLDGQSIGKKIMKLRAVNFDTNKPLTGDWAASATRNIPFAVPFFPLIEWIILLNNKKGQRLGDEWAKTKVIVVPDA